MRKIVDSCGNLDPPPDILEWSNVSGEMFKGSFKDKPTKWICYGYVDPYHQVMPLKVSSIEAIRVCENFKAELAYPKSNDEFIKWAGKFIS